jgi:hypothetical protein
MVQLSAFSGQLSAKEFISRKDAKAQRRKN